MPSLTPHPTRCAPRCAPEASPDALTSCTLPATPHRPAKPWRGACAARATGRETLACPEPGPGLAEPCWEPPATGLGCTRVTSEGPAGAYCVLCDEQDPRVLPPALPEPTVQWDDSQLPGASRVSVCLAAPTHRNTGASGSGKGETWFLKVKWEGRLGHRGGKECTGWGICAGGRVGGTGYRCW